MIPSEWDAIYLLVIIHPEFRVGVIRSEGDESDVGKINMPSAWILGADVLEKGLTGGP